MFTGIVAELGKLQAVRHERGLRLVIEAPRLAGGLHPGDSVAVNGTCLTVESAASGTFQATVQPQTARTTTLGRLAPGAPVNLEPALRLGDPLGGHLVAGHVDGVAVVSQVRQEGESLLITIRPPADLLAYLAPRGSVAVDGVSLTIAQAGPAKGGPTDSQHFTVSLVRYTLENTTLAGLRAGDRVNLEVDLVARYLERLLAARLAGRLDLSALGEEGYS